MDYLEQSFDVHFNYRVYFTSGIFSRSNSLLADFFEANRAQSGQKILFAVDSGVLEGHPALPHEIRACFRDSPVSLVDDLIVIPGGEAAKNRPEYFERLIEAVDLHKIDRHSYIAAVGGGSVLDLAGFAAAVAHRGIRHLRFPTTVLSQNDSGVGVKNGINYRGKKNFTGAFVPPVAVFNDALFLVTLEDRDWRSGIAEAIKVALIKDALFFAWIEDHMEQLVARDLPTMEQLIRRCAALHLEHIASGDPFELGSSRPLDFGHWSAHKLEQLSGFSILHGEAVAMGIVLDSVYSALSGRLSAEKADRIVALVQRAGFEISHPLMDIENESSAILEGLQEFREHLGGRLTIMLLSDIGKGVEVHELDTRLLKAASKKIKNQMHPAADTKMNH